VDRFRHSRRAAFVVAAAQVSCARPPPSAERPTPPPGSASTAESSGQQAPRRGPTLAPIFLGDTPVESHVDALPPTDRPLVVTIELVRTPPKGALDELRKRAKVLPAAPGSVSFAVVGYPASRDPIRPEDTRPSYVIDYDEPSVQQARADAVRVCGPSPTAEQLAVFVDRYIEHKDMLRAFDLASQVARRKEGDCTEHAVLLAALARSFGIPARVVSGMAIVSVGGKIQAVGHAWTEVSRSGRWQLADAAIPPELGARYLPMDVMTNEGPAFVRAMVERSSALMLVRRITIDPQVQSSKVSRTP